MLPNLISIKYEIPGLDGLLKDCEMKKLSFFQLPPSIRSLLLYNRKIINELHSLLITLEKWKLLTINFYDSKYIYRSNFRLNINVEIETSSEERAKYSFESVTDFDDFYEMIYHHLIMNYNCSNCPFNFFPDLHESFDVLTEPKVENTKNNQNLDETEIHRRKRKQNLKSIKNKRIKLEIISKDATNQSSHQDSSFEKHSNLVSNIRPSWTRQEDQFLLRCLLASNLMNSPPIFRFALHIDGINKLLHSRIDHSHNKTSLSCARRVLRLIRNPNIKRILAICELELRSSSTISPMIGKYLQDGENKIRQAFKTKNFSEILDDFVLLLEQITEFKFKNTEYFIESQFLCSSKLEKKIAPTFQNLDELLSSFIIFDPANDSAPSLYLDPKNYYDIHSYVITNVILSSMVSFYFHYRTTAGLTRSLKCWEQNLDELKRYFMKTVFKSLKQFPETLVRLVLKRLVQNRYVTFNRKIHLRSRKILPYSYKLCNGFFNEISLFHFPYELAHNHQNDGNKFELTIADNNTLIGAIEFAENLCAYLLNLNDTYENETSRAIDPKIALPFPPTLINDLDFAIKIPENFVHLSRNMLDENRKNSRGLLINKNSKIFKEKSINVSEQDDDIAVIHTYVTLRQSAYERPVFSQDLVDFIKSQCQIYSPESFDIISDCTLENKLNELSEIFLAKIGSLGSKRSFSDLIAFIRSKEEIGADDQNIMEFLGVHKISQKTLKNFLLICQNYAILFSVGIENRNWVHRNFIRHWMIVSFKNLDLNIDHLKDLERSSFKRIEKICFFPKLWKRPDGSLDRKLLMMFLNQIIGFITLNHCNGCDLETIAKYFRTHLPKVQLIELLDLLVLIDCIRITNLDFIEFDDRNASETLDDFFENSHRSDSILHENPKIIKEIYEVTVDSYCRLALLNDFIPKLIAS